MKKMFLRLVLICLCLWHLDGGFGVEVKYVKEGDSVTLNSDLTEMKNDDLIQWWFEITLLAEINKWVNRITVYDDVLDGRFRDRLKLDKQTGSLTITDIKTEHDGDYKLQINRMRKRFSLTVYVEISAKEGDSVTLNSDLTEMKDDGVILWRFGNTLIAEINKRSDRFTVNDDVLDGRFRDRLKLDNQTGSLSITNITTEHAGEYKLQINYMRVESFFLTVIDKVESVKEGDSVTLNSDLTEMKNDDVIQWRFRNTLIAEINKRFNRFTVYDDVLDGRFRDRLKLDNQTGSLTITNTTTEHAGVYKLHKNGINSPKSFRVSVSDEVKVSVKEGDSITLKTGLTEIKDQIICLWTFGPNKSLIAKLNRKSNKISIYDDVLDGRFRDRLNLDHQTGSLTITNITTEHAGLYEGTIEGKKEIRYRFSVSVSVFV